MRPLKLAVQGFTCFRQHTELDFGALELYAIQGPTGSGKSSLLDAVMYALYGQTPRLGKVGHEALISQGERALSVSLEFESGGERYRVARAKGRKQSDNEVRFEKWQGERFVGLTETKKAHTQGAIEAAVGLSFESFTRAVVLPQGQFDRFLRGTGKERQELLGALLELDHYKRMFERASEKKTFLTHELRATQALLDGEYAEVTPEKLAGWRAEAGQAERDAGRLEGERERLSVYLAELNALAELYGRWERARRAFSELEARRPGAQADLERAGRARRVAGVLPLLEARDRAGVEAERAGRAGGEAREGSERAEEAARTAAGGRERAETAAAEVPAMEARAEQLREAEGWIKVLRRSGGALDLPSGGALPWDEDAYLAARDQLAREQTLGAEQQACTLEGRELEALRLRVALGAENLAAWRGQLADLTVKGKAKRAERDAAQEELRLARERAGAAALRSHLHLGGTCPLCEQTVRALPTGEAPDLGALERRARTLEDALGALQECFSEVRGDIKAAEAADARDRSDLARREEALEARLAVLAGEREQLSGDARDTARRLLAGLAAQLRAVGEADPVRARSAVLGDVKVRRERLDLARRAESAAQSALAAARAALQGAERALGERGAELSAATERADAALTVLNLSEAGAREAALPESDIARFEEAHRTLMAAHEGRRREAGELEGELAGRTHDPEVLETAQRDLTACETALNAARRRAGELAQRVSQVAEQLARKRDLEALALRASHDLDTWSALTQALRANEFQQFLLAEVEASLLGRAGELLFEISDGRYRLLLEAGEYSVQDLWNAGEVRGVRTLSGGETFLASLSLAIALSDYLAGNRILGALFLDEGFGTLDPQALEAVAGALEKVRTQGRMVGVITHVESLSERLPARILVSKSVAGSRALRME